MRTLVMSTKTGQKGFTLVEIMIVVSILAILVTFGTIELLNYLPRMRLRSASRDIYSAMMQAKTEAIRRGESVTLLFNSPGGNYTMFLDRQPPPAGATANDDNDVVDPGETVLITATTLPPKVTFDPDPAITVDGDGVSFASNTAVFSMRGIPIGAGTVGLRATDSLGNTIRQRNIVVSFAGRIKMQ